MFEGIYKGKKVLITGDTGFKGSWLAIWLDMLGAEVYGYALPPKTEKDNYVICHVDSIISHEDGDIRDLTQMTNYFEKVNPDIVFHLAAQPLVLQSYDDPIETFSTNVMGTVNVLEALKSAPATKVLVNVTTDKCYDNKEWVWGYKESDAMGGKDPYSASKGCAELVTAAYRDSFFAKDKNIASARAGNVIGAGDWADNRIVPDFFKAVMSGKKMSIRNPNATRPWQHVLEPLFGYLLLGSKMFTSDDYNSGWNFGPIPSEHYSVKDLIDGFKLVYEGVEIDTPENELKPNEANTLRLDISKATTYLGWQPMLSFSETLAYTIDGYKADLAGVDILAARKKQITQFEKKILDSE